MQFNYYQLTEMVLHFYFIKYYDLLKKKINYIADLENITYIILLILKEKSYLQCSLNIK